MSGHHIRPTHRLRLLSVGVSRKQQVDAAASLANKCRAKRRNLLVQRLDRIETPQAQVGDDLVVARASGVKLSRNVAYFFVQQALDQRVDVLVRGVALAAAG